MHGFYLFAQLIGLAGTAVFFVSYQCKSNRRLFRLQLVSYLCYTVHLLLLGAVTGGVSYILNTVRSWCLAGKNEFLNSRTMCAILCALQLGALALTWGGWLSVLPVAGNIAATIAGYTHSGKKLRLTAMLVNSPLWLIYNFAMGSWAGILDELATEASILLSIALCGWSALDQQE